jgi:hypothetical protein
MAGPFTHMVICEFAADPSKASSVGRGPLPAELTTLLNDNHCFLMLGAVSPDLPAISDFIWKRNWSDAMHGGPFTRTIVDLFAQSFNCTAASRDAILAWLFGYVGHIVADAVVHPVVNVAMADVKIQGIHQEIEICIDSLLYDEKKHGDLQLVPYLDGLRACRKSPEAFAELMDLWQKCISTAEPSFDGDPVEWYGTYLAGFHAATTMAPPDAAANLHFIHTFANYVYQPVSAISDKDRTRFYNHVAIPIAPGHGSFVQDVFNRALGHLIDIWGEMWKRVPVKGSIGNCNLNTGADTHTYKLVLWRQPTIGGPT